jgi:ATP-binding cassette subfamily F protein uup
MLVSHDRQFVDNTVTECWIFEGEGRIGQYVGGYHDARGQQAQYLAQKQPISKKAVKLLNRKQKVSNAPGKLSYNLQRELEQLPQSWKNWKPSCKSAGAGCRSFFLWPVA